MPEVYCHCFNCSDLVPAGEMICQECWCCDACGCECECDEAEESITTHADGGVR